MCISFTPFLQDTAGGRAGARALCCTKKRRRKERRCAHLCPAPNLNIWQTFVENISLMFSEYQEETLRENVRKKRKTYFNISNFEMFEKFALSSIDYFLRTPQQASRGRGWREQSVYSIGIARFFREYQKLMKSLRICRYFWHLMFTFFAFPPLRARPGQWVPLR